MARTTDVVLGGQTYTLEQLPMRANREWREKVAVPVDEMVALVLQYGTELEINSAGDLVKLLSAAKHLVIGSIDKLVELLFAYSAVLRADRERIENEATDDEAMAALGEVVRFAYPLDRALQALRGSPAMPISTNSPLPNGANGTNKRTADRHRSTTRT